MGTRSRSGGDQQVPLDGGLRGAVACSPSSAEVLWSSRSSTWRCVAALSCSCSVSGRRRPRRSKSWCCRNTVSTVKQVHRQHALGLGAAEPPPGQRRPLGRRFDARPVEDGPYRAGPDPEAQAAQLTVDATVAQLGFSLANRTTNARSSAVTAGRPRRCGSFRRWAMALAATAPGSQPPWGAGRRARRAHDCRWDGPPFAIGVAAPSGAGVSAQLNQDGEPRGIRLPWVAVHAGRSEPGPGASWATACRWRGVDGLGDPATRPGANGRPALH